MTIHPLNPANVALFLSAADLAGHGLAPETLTPDQARELTLQACAQAGLALAAPVHIQAFPDCQGVLVFAQSRPTGPVWFTFPDIEPVLQTALALGNRPVDAALWWWEDQYWLALPPEAEGAGAVCAEFGTVIQPDPLLCARLEEAGQSIFPHQALGELSRHFLRLHLGNL